MPDNQVGCSEEETKLTWNYVGGHLGGRGTGSRFLVRERDIDSSGCAADGYTAGDARDGRYSECAWRVNTLGCARGEHWSRHSPLCDR